MFGAWLELSVGRLDMEHGGSGGASIENWEVDLSLPQQTASLYIRGGFTLRREPKVTGYGPERERMGRLRRGRL